MPAVTSKATAVAYVKRKLGDPTVHLEITDDQLDDCIDDVLRLFLQYLPVRRPAAYMNQVGDVSIDFPATADGVLYCTVLRPKEDIALINVSIWELMNRFLPARIPIGEYYELRSFFEMYQRARGTDPTWAVDRGASKLYVDCYSGPYDIYVVWSEDATITSFMTGDKRTWQDDFLRACVAEAKLVLATVRGKFGNVPVPGGALTTDSDAMKSEATLTLTETRTKLANAAKAYYQPVIG